jgi:hypothetical protein
VHVTAASLKNIDKALASGSHYGSDGRLPIVCGVDGVGVLEDGTRVFCGGALRGHFDIVLDYVWGHPTENLARCPHRP